MLSIRLQFEQAKHGIMNLETAETGCTRVSKNIDLLADNLSMVWSGKASSAFEKKLREWNSETKSIVKEINKITTEFKKRKEDLENADLSNHYT